MQSGVVLCSCEIDDGMNTLVVGMAVNDDADDDLLLYSN